MFAIEATAAIDAGGTLQTFYFASDDFTSAPTDTPANTYFPPALIDPGSLGISAFSAGRTTGQSRIEVGEVRIANVDGQFDAFKGYSFDGRQIIIRSGLATAAYPGSWSKLLTATVEAVEMTFSEVILRLRDLEFSLGLPACPNRYGGTNALPNGIDGVANDLQGTRKPRVYGLVRSVEPVQVNTSKLIYQIHDGKLASVQTVYDRGLALTFGTNRADNAAMQATAPAAGAYDTCLNEGLIRLGSTPTGRVTVDATEGTAAANRTAGSIIQRIAGVAGVTSFNAASFTAIDTDTSSAVCGISLRDETFAEAISLLAGGVGAYWAFDTTGAVRVGVLKAPTGSAVVEINTTNALNGIERRTASDAAVPKWRVVANYSRLGTVQTSDLAGAVTAAERARLGQAFRSVASEDATIKGQFQLAGELLIDTVFTASADATTFAAAQLALYKVQRDTFEVPVPIEIVTGNGLWLLDVVSLKLDRFGMSAGKLFRVVGLRLELKANRAVLTLWG